MLVALADDGPISRQRDALWASFQASVSTPPSNSDGGDTSSPAVRRVKIAKTYLFAGKHVTYVSLFLFLFSCFVVTHDLGTHVVAFPRIVTFLLYARASTFYREVVEVAEGSEEAKKWPRWSPRPTPDASTPPADKGEAADGPAPPPAVDPGPAQSTTATSTPGANRPGPRKPRTALPSIPKASQAKKITTLDKSAMDWRAHVASQSGDVKGELDANRRGGGYLEKVDFLKRVEDRREDAFEASKSSKRRKT